MNPVLITVFLTVLAFCESSSQYKQTTCLLPTSDDEGYDLRFLGAHEYKLNSDNFQFDFSICHPLSSGKCLSSNPDCSICDSTSETCLASSSSMRMAELKSENEGVVVTYSNGPITTQIDFVCDYSAGFGSPVFLGEYPKNQFYFVWRSSVGCPYVDPCRMHSQSCGMCVAHLGCGWCSSLVPGTCFCDYSISHGCSPVNTTAITVCGASNVITNPTLC